MTTSSTNDATITKSGKGGLALTTSVKLTKLSPGPVKGIAEGYGVSNGNILIREDVTDDQLIDVLTGNRRYVPSLAVLNKVDLVKLISRSLWSFLQVQPCEMSARRFTRGLARERNTPSSLGPV